MKKLTKKMVLTMDICSMLLSVREEEKIQIIQYKVIKKNDKYILYYKNLTENFTNIITKSKYQYPVEKMFITLCKDSIKQLDRKRKIY